MTLPIRRWTSADFAGIRNVLARTWKEAYGAFIPPEDLNVGLESWYSDEALARNLSDPAVKGYVAVQDDAIVASMRTWLNAAEGRFYVSSLYVLPEAQGRGIGRLLMEAAAVDARAQGKDHIWLGVMTVNTPALRWYQHYGYTIVSEEPFTMGATTLRHFIGHLPVASFLPDARHERGGV